MINLIKASLFKLFKDRTFHITAIVGGVLAILLIGIRYLSKECNGQSFFLNSLTPGSSFGLTIPINLIVFTVGEFTYGTVRNKIIAGISKAKVYIGLFITGLVFTFILAAAFSILTIGISSLIGGFNLESIGGSRFALSYVAYVVCSYIFVTALSIFFATIFRQIGGSNTIVIILLVFLSLLPLIIFSTMSSSGLSVEHWTMWINPIYMPGLYGNNVVSIITNIAGDSVGNLFYQSEKMIAAGIITPAYWTLLFFIGGLLIFKNSDVK